MVDNGLVHSATATTTTTQLQQQTSAPCTPPSATATAAGGGTALGPLSSNAAMNTNASRGGSGTGTKVAHNLGTLINQPTLVTKDKLKFLILDAPHYDNIMCYIKELQRHNVTDLVRTCERTYDESVVEQAGITPHDIVANASKHNAAVGVHCLAGLGRAPVLVVIALIEHGMRNIDAIELVRSQRRGVGAVVPAARDGVVAYFDGYGHRIARCSNDAAGSSSHTVPLSEHVSKRYIEGTST